MSPNHFEIINLAATRLTKPHGGQRVTFVEGYLL